MRICYVASDSGLYGSTLSLLGLVRAMRDRGHDVFVITMNRDGYLVDELTREGIAFACIPNRYVPIVKMTLSFQGWVKTIAKRVLKVLTAPRRSYRFKQVFRQHDFDIVHYNTSTIDNGFSVVSKQGIPIVWHFRELLEEDQSVRWINRRRMLDKVGQASCVIGVSQAIVEKYQGVLPAIRLVYNGIVVEPFRSLKRQRGEGIRIGIVGSLAKSKGQLEVVRAFAQLVDAGLSTVSLTIFGKFDPVGDEYCRELADEVRRRHLTDRVRFAGQKYDVHEIWESIDITVVASVFEAFGRVTIEGVLAQTIVVGADTGGTKELLEYLRTGLLYRQSDVSDLARQLKNAVGLVDDPSEREKLRQASLRAFAEFSAQENARKISEIYENLLLSGHDKQD